MNIASKKIHVIVNPISGIKEDILPVLKDILGKTSLEWSISLTKKAGDATAFSQEAVKRDVDAIVVYGGDGTVTEVVSGMVGSKIPLVILPGGSGNVMAVELGISKNIQEAFRTFYEELYEIRSVDVGQFDQRCFILRTSLGVEAEIVKGADREMKNKVGWLAYWLSSWRALREARRADYEITVDGVRCQARGVTCVVANSGNLGFPDLVITDKISVSDGLLDVIVVRRASWRLLGHVMRTLLRRKPFSNVRLVKRWQGKKIMVTSRPQQFIQCDGEILPKGPVDVTVIPGAVNIVVPKSSQ